MEKCHRPSYQLLGLFATKELKNFANLSRWVWSQHSRTYRSYPKVDHRHEACHEY